MKTDIYQLDFFGGATPVVSPITTKVTDQHNKAQTTGIVKRARGYSRCRVYAGEQLDLFETVTPVRLNTTCKAPAATYEVAPATAELQEVTLVL